MRGVGNEATSGGASLSVALATSKVVSPASLAFAGAIAEVLTWDRSQGRDACRRLESKIDFNGAAESIVTELAQLKDESC
jgi:hypothetical protein